MRFIEQFEFLKLLHNDGAATWLVIEKSSGRRLLLHKYPKESKLREQLLSMPPDQLIKLISAGEDEGFYIVVSHDLPELRNFCDWVESGAPAELAKTAPPAPISRNEANSPRPGEFTRMFQTPVLPNEANRPAGQSEPKRAGSEPPVLRNEANSPSPGEFTRMFQTPVLPNEPKRAGSEPPVSPNEANSPRPGEFTRMFQTPVLPNEANRPATQAEAKRPAGQTEPKSPVSEPPVLRNEPNSPRPGEFTRMFQTPVLRDEPKSAVSEPAKKPGEFTKIFGSPFATPSPSERIEPPPPPPGPKRPAGDFTRIFGTTEKSPAERPNAEHATGIFSQPKFQESALKQPAQPSGPSEYTRIIRTGGTGPASEAASQQVTPSPEQGVTPEKSIQPGSTAAKPKNPLPLVIILGVLVIAAVGLVLYFVIKR